MTPEFTLRRTLRRTSRRTIRRTLRQTRALAAVTLAASTLLAVSAQADPQSIQVDPSTRFSPAAPAADPTGGAYTTPTLLFVPAGAVPAWTARAIASVDMQGPTTADRLAAGTSIGFQPGLGGEIGLPGGFTLGSGTKWVGGDLSPTPVSGGLSPYAQARYQIAGTGQGLTLGTSLTYKFVGFEGDPGEMELAFSGQLRRSRFEVGLQLVFGKDFATTDADGEVHAYALYRIVPELGVGAAAQVRLGIVSQPGDRSYDLVSGAIASLTLGRWQLGLLGGETTVGLDPGKVGALAEVFGSARF